ncbi:oligosaccharide flippase family protein [Aliagarivorans marinus]|uniref:oligosaccharide flippase family protein n=1 Tax=Aliagarivorans marinus TaxID=561965 RepID=UPI0003F751B5|nr:oligosaccharide flippase family protein [Aliagarivorans marinus]
MLYRQFANRMSDNLGSGLLLQAAISVVARVLSAGAGFAASVALGRSLGAEQSGYYFLGFTLITILAAFSRLGLDSTVMRYTAQAHPDYPRRLVWGILRRGMLLTSGGGVLLSLGVYILAPWLATRLFHKPELADVLRYMSPSVMLLACFTLVAMSLQGQRRTVRSVFTLNISINLGLILLLWLQGASSASQAAWAFSLSAALTLVSGLWLCRGQPSTELQCPLPSWSQLFSSCLPLWVVMIMGQLTQWVGQIAAGAYVSSSEVALLAVAQRTAMLTSFILIAVNMVVAPRFSALHAKGESQKIRSLTRLSVRWMLIVALPVFAVMLLLPERLLSLFGPEFSAGYWYLRILAVGQLVNVATGSVAYLLAMSGNERDLRNAALFSGMLAVVLAWFLTRGYGAIGSAIATAVAVACQNLLAVYWVKRRLGFNTLLFWRS